MRSRGSGYYSDFQSYKLHLSPLIACGEGVGGGVLVLGLMTICCRFFHRTYATGTLVACVRYQQSVYLQDLCSLTHPTIPYNLSDFGCVHNCLGISLSILSNSGEGFCTEYACCNTSDHRPNLVK